MTDRFELLEQLGKGGMGAVWKARDRQTGEVVALKLLHDMYLDDPAYVARFEREVDIARRIDSPFVVKVRGYGVQTGRPYVAMEYIDGPSLKDRLKAGWRPDWSEARRVFGELLDGLAAAHAAGVLHRDIKPGNLLVTRRGTIKLTDFGISRAADLTRLTGSATTLGTPTYMAPEGQVDERSDVYSAGCVLFEMLAGRPPFEGDTMHTIILKHLREPPDVSLLPVDARQVVSALLAKEPEARPTTAKAHELLAHSDRTPTPAEASAPTGNVTYWAPPPGPKLEDPAFAPRERTGSAATVARPYARHGSRAGRLMLLLTLSFALLAAPNWAAFHTESAFLCLLAGMAAVFIWTFALRWWMAATGPVESLGWATAVAAAVAALVWGLPLFRLMTPTEFRFTDFYLVGMATAGAAAFFAVLAPSEQRVRWLVLVPAAAGLGCALGYRAYVMAAEQLFPLAESTAEFEAVGVLSAGIASIVIGMAVVAASALALVSGSRRGVSA